MAFSDIFKGLDDLIVRKKAIEPAQDKLQEINDLLTTYSLTGQGPPEVTKLIPRVAKGVKAGEQPVRLPTSNLMNELGNIINKPEDRGPIDIPGTISKGAGVALTPLNIASDIAQQAITPALNVLKPLQDFRYGPMMDMAELESQSDVAMKMFEQEQNNIRQQLEQEHDIRMQDLKQSAPPKTIEEMYSRGLIGEAEYKRLKKSSQKASWADLFSIAYRKKLAGDSSMWDSLLEYREAGKLSLGFDIEEELKRLGEEPPENPEGDLYFVDRQKEGETTFRRKPRTPPDATVKGPFLRKK